MLSRQHTIFIFTLYQALWFLFLFCLIFSLIKTDEVGAICVCSSRTINGETKTETVNLIKFTVGLAYLTISAGGCVKQNMADLCLALF